MICSAMFFKTISIEEKRVAKENSRHEAFDIALILDET